MTGRSVFWRRPGVWVLLSVLAAVSTCAVYFVGMFSGGHEIDETCQRLGQPYDEAYRSAHWEEPGRWFPQHNKCNAGFDLVPAWLNPALVCLAVVTVACVVLAMAMGMARVVKILDRRKRIRA
jgi:hypothetical protein